MWRQVIMRSRCGTLRLGAFIRYGFGFDDFAGGRGVGLGSVGGPLVYVAAGHNEVALWDAATGRVHQVRILF